MNYGIVLKVLGIILIIEASLMLPSFFISYFTGGGDLRAFGLTILLAFVVGFLLSKKKHKNHISPREGLAIVSLSWILASAVGALPLYLSKSVPSFIDGFFEIVSGFTTTGATVISNVEELPQGILFWRSFTHWIGGMGILVFTVALMPALGIGGFQIFKAESPGPVAGKIAPKIKDTAKILYGTYFTITIVQIILLLFGGMNLFDSLVYTFGTVGTGGFATKANSVGYYESSYIQMVIAIFMVMSGVNFSLYYGLSKGKVKEFFKDEELRLYLIIVGLATLAISLNLLATSYTSLRGAFKDSFFQVGSIITTTGYSTVDFDLWPSFSKGILLLLMFIGGSAGSTAGGLKVIRILILLKLIKKEIAKIFHPRAIVPIKVNGKTVSSDVISSIGSFMALYFLIFTLSTILVSLQGVDLESAISSVAATLSNIGPGFGFAGPSRGFWDYCQPLKLLFSFLMLAGRLELFTLLALLMPKTWRKDSI